MQLRLYTNAINAFKLVSLRLFYLLINKIESIRLRGKNLTILENCVCGENSIFYKESQLINLQNTPNKIIIGKNTHIRGSLLIYPYGKGLSIGDNSYIGEYSIIRAANEIKIGSNVLIAHNVTIIDTDSHELDAQKRADSFKRMINEGHPNTQDDVLTSPITIDDYAWISYGVCILKGVHIGEGAIVGAGSVVTKDVPPYTVVAGNPSRIIRKLSIDNNKSNITSH